MKHPLIENLPIHILAFDPGITTGYARIFIDYPNQKVLIKDLKEFPNYSWAMDLMRPYLDHSQDTLVLIERITPLTMMATVTEAIMVAGGVRFAAEYLKLKVLMRTPSTRVAAMKRYATIFKPFELGGKRGVDAKNGPHMADALGHAIGYVYEKAQIALDIEWDTN